MPVNRNRKTVGFTLDPALVERAKAISATSGFSVSRIIDKALAAMLPVYEKDPGAMVRPTETDEA